MGFQLGDVPHVAMAFCGDGATSTGTWHESVNFAAVFDLPIVFIIENNQYAYSTPARRQYRVPHLVHRAAAYGIPGVRVDGNDVVAVHQAACDAMAAARAGHGPTLIEAVTMRIDGHAVHDAADYVPPDLIAKWKARDPIAAMRARLKETGVDDTALVAIDADVTRQIVDAVEIARTDPDPHPGREEAAV